MCAFSASARVMVVPASLTSIAMAQTPGPCVTWCEWAKPSGSQLITNSILPCDQRSTFLLRWEPGTCRDSLTMSAHRGKSRVRRETGKE